MFAAHEQVRDSKVVVYQKAGILLLLFTTIKIWYFFISFRSKGSLNLSGLNKWNMLNFMPIVYFGDIWIIARK